MLTTTIHLYVVPFTLGFPRAAPVTICIPHWHSPFSWCSQGPHHYFHHGCRTLIGRWYNPALLPVISDLLESSQRKLRHLAPKTEHEVYTVVYSHWHLNRIWTYLGFNMFHWGYKQQYGDILGYNGNFRCTVPLRLINTNYLNSRHV